VADFPTNSIGLIFSVSGFVFLLLLRPGEPWNIRTLIAGIAMVFLATVSFSTFTNINIFFDISAQNHRINEVTHSEAKAVAGIWVFVLPAIVLSIGSNLISSWFLSKEPSKNHISED
jgi:hypothetical protein